MSQWQFIFGRLTLEITCADSVLLLDALSRANITMRNVMYCGDLSLQVTIAHSDYKQLQRIAEKQGANVKILHATGIYQTGLAMIRRPVLLAFTAIILILGCYLPSRVLFVSVEGNLTIPSNLILEAAEECGIGFGAARRQVRSEAMKNALLQKIPQLQWAGINTSGCTAVISVREKTVQQPRKNTGNQVSSIVAARDGIIQNCTVFQGNPLCTVGQAVKAGQTLVSGYLDLGIVTKTTQADAEIKALTFRELEVFTPAAAAVRGEMYAKKTVYSIKLGKKIINLYKDSGISDTSCVKIYSEEYVRLPGGFQLPIAIIKQTLFFYEDSEQTTAVSDSEDWLAGFAQAHLQGTMIAGEIISSQTEINPTEDACYLYGKYACMEMIGQVKYEQTIIKGENND